MKRSVIILVVTMALSFGCAASKQSIIQRVDPVSVRDAGRLDQDAAECLKYAEWAADECKKQAGINLGAGAVVGAGVGALVGLIVGHNTAGMASAIKQALPRCRVYGVEPTGADSMHRSFAAGSPQSIETVRTIADSLGAPHAAPYSFELCRRFIDELVLVDDDQLRDAMLLLFSAAKLAVEPAGAAATAALLGPLREKLSGRRVGVIVCGGNIDPATFSKQLADAAARAS